MDKLNFVVISSPVVRHTVSKSHQPDFPWIIYRWIHCHIAMYFALHFMLFAH